MFLTKKTPYKITLPPEKKKKKLQKTKNPVNKNNSQTKPSPYLPLKKTDRFNQMS